MEENGSLFRSAQAEREAPSRPEPPRDAAETAYSGSDMPPSLYVEALRTPLVADMLNASKAYDRTDIRNFSESIDRIVNSEVVRKGMPDTRASYEQIVNDALKELQLPPNADLHRKLEKLYEYVRISAKIHAPLRRTQASKPLYKMDTKELRQYLHQTQGIPYA